MPCASGSRTYSQRDGVKPRERHALRRRIVFRFSASSLVPTKKQMDTLMAGYFMHGKNEAAFEYDMERAVEASKWPRCGDSPV